MSDISAETLKAVAEIIRAVAWPLVAVGGGIAFRDDLRALAKRLRKGGPAEFDPPAQAFAVVADVSTTAVAIAKTAGSALSSLPASATTSLWEKAILESEPLKSITDPTERQQVLTRLAARAVVIGLFEVTEANIYASQVALLTFLNANRPGIALADLKAVFYDKAVGQHPAIYVNYPFESYLGFLQRYNLVAIEQGLSRITAQGIEYLAWRMEQGKPPRPAG